MNPDEFLNSQDATAPVQSREEALYAPVQYDEPEKEENAFAPEPEESVEQPQAEQPAEPQERKSVEELQQQANNIYTEMYKGLAMGAGAVGLGTLDFGVDLAKAGVEALPGDMSLQGFDDEYERLTKIDNPVLQKVREFASVIVPTMTGTGLVAGAVKGLALPGIAKGTLGIAGAASVDAAVIGISDQGFEDNGARVIADTFPGVFGPNGRFPIPEQWKTLDGDSPEVRKIKNVHESVGLSIIGDALGFILSNGKPILQWFSPKDVKARIFKQRMVRGSDMETNMRLGEIDRLINEAAQGRQTAGTKKVVQALTQERDRLVQQLDNTGRSEATTATPFGKYREDANASRDLQVEEEAYRQLDLNFDNDNYNPAITPKLANDAATTQQSLPVANVARNKADVAAINAGIADGNPAPLSNAFLKNGLILGKSRKAVAAFAESAREAGRYDATINGIRISDNMMDDESWNIYRDLMRPGSTEDLRKAFVPADVKQLRGGKEVRYMSDIQEEAAAFAINDLVNLYLGREVTESSARLMFTFGKEIQAFSEAGMTFKEIADEDHIMDMALDRLEFLISEFGLSKYIAGRTLQLKGKLMKRILGSENPAEIAALTAKEFDDISQARRAEVAQFRQTVEQARKENPELVRPLFEAFADSKGDVVTINGLYKWAENQLTPMGFFVSPERGKMNMFARGLWGVRYNNVLSGLAAARALVGNSASLLNQYATAMWGHGLESIMTRSFEPMRKAIYYHSAVQSTLARATADALDRMKKIHADPISYEQAIRADYLMKDEKTWDTLEMMLPHWEKTKNYGMIAQYGLNKMLWDLSSAPQARYGTTLMSGFDAATDTFQATLLSRVAAMEQVVKKGDPITPEALMQAEKINYSNMFDENGLLKQGPAKVASGEVALNLDQPIASGINQAIASAPILKSFFMFGRTAFGWAQLGLSYTPLARIPGLSRTAKILNAGNDMTKIKEALALHGIKNFDETPYAMEYYKYLRNTYRARYQMGAAATALLYNHALQGKITGNGPFNASERRKLRDNYDWKPKHIELFGKRINYDGIPGLDPVLTILGDLAYYNKEVGFKVTENTHKYIAWTLSATFINNTPLQGVEPVIKAFSGDENALRQFVARETRATIPFSGGLGVVANAIESAQKDIYKDLQGYINNSLPGLKNTLPNRIDYWTGNPIRDIENPLLRALNAGSPLQISDGREDWRLWLQNSGWPGMIAFTKHTNGVPYTAEQREAFGRIIGELELYKQVIPLMNNKGINEQLEEFKAYTRSNASEEDIELAANNLPVFQALDKIVYDARKAVEKLMEERYPEISAIGDSQRAVNNMLRRGAPMSEVGAAADKLQQNIDQIRQYGN